MSEIFHKLFIEHPASVNETQFTHGVKAIWFGTRLISQGVCEFVHALVPGIDIFQLCGTSSDAVLEKIVGELRTRRTEAEHEE